MYAIRSYYGYDPSDVEYRRQIVDTTKAMLPVLIDRFVKLE